MAAKNFSFSFDDSLLDWSKDVLEKTQGEELFINSFEDIFFQKGDSFYRIQSPFKDKDQWLRHLQRFSFYAGVRLDPMSPSAGGDIQRGHYRWHGIIPPLSKDGVFCIRRHQFSGICLNDFQINIQQKAMIEDAISNDQSILICGKTGSGKTTFLVSLLKAYFFEKRLAIIESLREIPNLSENWICLSEEKPKLDGSKDVGIFELIRECLRLRPDHMVVGELIDKEIVTFLETIVSGHGSGLATIHAGNLRELRTKLSLMFLKCGFTEGFVYGFLETLEDMIVVFLHPSEKRVASVECFKN